MTAEGIVVLPHSPHAIRTQPDQVLRDLKGALSLAASRPRPHVRAVPDATNGTLAG
jgi:hypothetical protein